MKRSFYLDLAESGHCAPIGTHLVLHQKSDPAAVVLDGRRLGDVITESADTFQTPLAVPLMDLTLEKAALLGQLGVPAEEVDSYHFESAPGEPGALRLTPRMRATCEAIQRVADRVDLLPMGMGIGPFSLMTKLVSDPITPVFLAASGMDAAEEPEVGVVERCLETGEALIREYLGAQCDAGAKAVIVCEPAANLVYFSPNQLADSYEIFDRYVMAPMRRIAAMLEARGVDLVFHDCGELTDGMVERFGGLNAAMMSLGSSRLLWEDAGRIPKDTVLYGNLPTKRFYSPQLSVEEVEALADNLLRKMKECGHPFILGSECDILSVPDSEREITSKVEAFLRRK